MEIEGRAFATDHPWDVWRLNDAEIHVGKPGVIERISSQARFPARRVICSQFLSYTG